MQIVLASDVKISTNSNESVVIEIQNKSTNEKIKIFDNNGTLLFFDHIKKEHYLKVFAMDKLPYGEYHVIYEDDTKISLAIVVKSKDGMLLTSDFSYVKFKPMINQKNDYLNIGFTNSEYNDVDISISDDQGNELIEITNLKGLIIKKTFNTKNLPAGEYVIKLKSGNQTFTNRIVIG
jgi:hypothetical protein